MNYLREVKEKLMEREQEDLIELLGISSEDIVDRFDDYIEENLRELIQSELGEIIHDFEYEEVDEDI